MCELISHYILYNNTEDGPVSLAQCLPAICIGINIPNMLLRCGKILCTINAFLFLCQLIFDLIKWHLLDHHRGMDKHPPGLMLFLHEDILHGLLYMSRSYSTGGLLSQKLDAVILADQHMKRQVVVLIHQHHVSHVL